jgi:hypothetical protein
VAVQEQHRRLPAGAARSALLEDVMTGGLAILAVYQLALALFMVAAPHSFFANIGPFGTRNDHYIRDTATFSAAIGLGLAIAVRNRSWRVPMLAITTAQFALHSVNHLVDIEKSHPAWNGYFDFFSLAGATLLLAWLLRLALAQARGGSNRPTKEFER